jgi:hypothetical protein
MYFSFVAFPALAAETGSCLGLDSIGNLVGETKSFANASIRVASVTTVQPLPSPEHLLVFVYGSDGLGRSCTAVNADIRNIGFKSIDMAGVSVVTDTNTDLILTIPTRVWVSTSGSYANTMVRVRVQIGGRVSIEN